MGEWLRGGLSAARLAVDRADLWFAGAVVSFAFAGWVVFLAVVMSPIDEGDILYAAIRLASSDTWPWNVPALASVAAAGAGFLLLAVALGETTLMAGLRAPEGMDAPEGVGRTMAVLGLTAVPVVVLGLALAWLLSPALLHAFERADPSTPYLARLLREGWPALVLFGLGAIAAQACGAIALRARPIHARAWATVRGHLARMAAQAAVTFGLFVGAQAGTFVALRTLWEPLTDRLAPGRPAELSTVVLLLGFVWIWLVLVILAGVLQAWITAWWDITLAQRPGG